jgi:4,5-dihydroxyphthalate decarboxylase
MDVIRVACRRHDWSEALFDGRVAVPSLEIVPEAHLEIDALTGTPRRVDFMEVGLLNYYRARSAGAAIQALPVFLRAAYRHNYIFVNAKSGINEPKDLEGKRVGTRYGMTATLWSRGLLQHQYGVALEKIHWLNQGTISGAPYALPRGLVLEPVPPEVNLQQQLIDGEIDALIHPDLIPTKLLAHASVRRLFADAPEAERAYYRATGIVPVMNTIAFRTSERPETVAVVFDGFRRAKAAGLEAMQDVRNSGLLWSYEALEAQIALMGPDPVPYSVEAMRPTLQALVDFGLEQGVFVKRLSLQDLFLSE